MIREATSRESVSWIINGLPILVPFLTLSVPPFLQIACFSDSTLSSQLYAKLTGYSTQEARLSYLDYVKSWKIYGSAYFFAEPQNSSLRFPSAIVLAINSKGILIVDPDSKEFLAEYTFKDVVTWGHSSNSFVVVTGGMMRQTKIYFKTDQGKEINSIVKSYVERVMGPKAT